MSCLRQLVVNITCRAQNEINNANENLDLTFLFHGSTTDQNV